MDLQTTSQDVDEQEWVSECEKMQQLQTAEVAAAVQVADAVGPVKCVSVDENEDENEEENDLPVKQEKQPALDDDDDERKKKKKKK